MMVTGSGTLTLSGSLSQQVMLYTNRIQTNAQINTLAADFPTPFVYTGFAGPFLSIIHNYNFCVKNEITNDASFLTAPERFFGGVQGGIDPEI